MSPFKVSKFTKTPFFFIKKRHVFIKKRHVFIKKRHVFIKKRHVRGCLRGGVRLEPPLLTMCQSTWAHRSDKPLVYMGDSVSHSVM
jgi:hypothetical protein